MKLMTKEIEQKLLNAPIYSKDGMGKDAEVVVKYHNPEGAGVWLITEGEKIEDTDNWLFFGYCNIFEWEWGYVSLSDLQSVSTIEIDFNVPEGATVRDLCDEPKYTSPIEER